MLKILTGDCRDILPTLPAKSVQCCVTSPPYWGLRDYGTAQWEGGDPECEHKIFNEMVYLKSESTSTLQSKSLTNSHGQHGWKSVCGHCGARRIDSQLGLESTPEEYITKMVAVFREVWRVLRDDGTLWVNMGDSYASGEIGRHDKITAGSLVGNDEKWNGNKRQSQKLCTGLKSKDLCMIPARLAMALQADGWYLRSEIVWHKPNPMPESVQGSHFSRHRVTVEEYENLSGLRYEGERAGDDWAGDMPDLSEIEIPMRKAPLSAKREGKSNGKSPRRPPGCKREASTICSISTGEKERTKVSTDAEREGQHSETCSQLQGTAKIIGRSADSGTMDNDLGAAQTPLLLLQEGSGKDDIGSCDSAEQRRTELSRERGASVPFVQLQEAEQDVDALLVGCPGCEKCEKYHGYIFHLSAGRPTKAHEMIYLLAKQERYFYDAEAIREPSLYTWNSATSTLAANGIKNVQLNQMGQRRTAGADTFHRDEDRTGRNKRSVWTIATQPYSEAHFATFPEDLIKPCIMAGSRAGDIVLDPFAGSGTTGKVALELGRKAILIELNPAYVKLAEQRTNVTPGMF